MTCYYVDHVTLIFMVCFTKHYIYSLCKYVCNLIIMYIMGDLRERAEICKSIPFRSDGGVKVKNTCIIPYLKSEWPCKASPYI